MIKRVFAVLLVSTMLLVSLPAAAKQEQENSANTHGVSITSQTEPTKDFVPRLSMTPETAPAYYTTLNFFYNHNLGMPNCTCYAYGRAYEILGHEPNLCHGNAKDWWNYNKNNNYYPYGRTPALGAVVCWTNDEYGHVAVVEQIDGDYIITSESSWNPSRYFFTTRRSMSGLLNNSEFQGFIYINDPYANLGDDFYAVILNYECWKPIEMNTQNYKIYLQTEVGSAAQKWRFQRQSDGAYVITSCYNGRALEMTDGIREVCTQLSARPFWGGAYQQWFLIRYGNGYIFKSKHFQDENWCMDLYGANSYDGNIIQINNRNNSTAQIWSIYTGDEVQLHGTTITASVDGNNVTVTWPRVYGALSYNLKIWKDELWQGDVFYAEYDTHSGTTFSLPRGTYYMYVDSVDYYQYFMSNVVTLQITTDPIQTLIGDADNNGTVDSVDALLILRYALGIVDSLPSMDNADATGDGAVDSVDALMVLRHALGIITL